MKLKQAAHEIVERNHRWINEVAVEGEVYVKGVKRHGWSVTMTYAKYGIVFRGTGVSYFNIDDPTYSQRVGYELARGRAELDLGVQLIKDYAEYWDDFPDKIANRIRLDSVHRLPGDVKWKEMSLPRSRKPKRNTSSRSAGKNTESQGGNGRVPADSLVASGTPSSQSGYSTDAQYAARCVVLGERATTTFGTVPVTEVIITSGE